MRHFLVKNGKGEGSLLSHNLHFLMIFTRSVEIEIDFNPSLAIAGQAGLGEIRNFSPPTAVARFARLYRERTEPKIEQVKNVTSQINEKSTSGNRRIESPIATRQVLTRVKAIIDFLNLAQCSRRHDLANPPEFPQASAIKSGIQWKPGLRKSIPQPLGIGRRRPHRFFDVAWFSRLGDQTPQFQMTRGRTGYIDRIDFRISKQGIDLAIPPWHIMTLGVIASLFRIATHYRHQRAIRNFAQGRAAFDFRHVTASENSPPDQAI